MTGALATCGQFVVLHDNLPDEVGTEWACWNDERQTQPPLADHVALLDEIDDPLILTAIIAANRCGIEHRQNIVI